MDTLQQEHYVTLTEYNSLPEHTRAEVYDGTIKYMASPSEVHQTILLELATILNSYIKKKNGNCKVLPAPFDVKLNDNPLTIVQPDIMIVCDKNKLDGKCVNGAPDFIIEIVSPSNASDDYIKKLYYYEHYGVQEYWIVDPTRKTITVNYFKGDIISVSYPFSSTIQVHIYDDLFINFSELEQYIK